MSQVDWLILTAANRVQARSYAIQLRARQQRGALPANRWMVVPDPGGRRAGSGGSTLWVLFQLARALLRRHRPGPRSLSALFAGKRILMIHSGGDSRRLCAYAAQGKVFLPLPCRTGDGSPAALFDLILEGLTTLPAPENGQVLIAAGDVLLTFDKNAVNFSNPGVVGVAYAGAIERGMRHGVYVADRDGHVRDFLQKPDEKTARDRGAVDAAGRVLIDTGIVSLDPQTAGHWLKAAGARMVGGRLDAAGILKDLARRRSRPIDLYEQLLMALVPALDEPSYMQAVAGHSSPEARAWYAGTLPSLYRALHGEPFRVNVLPYCDFFHIGTTRELLSNISVLNRTARTHGFANFDMSFVADRASLEGAFVYNSVLRSPRISAGQGVLLEAVRTRQNVELPGPNVVVGWPEEVGRPVGLPAGWGIVCLPVTGATTAQPDQWSAVLFGIDDDFKTSVEELGTFGNLPMRDFLERHRIPDSIVWGSDTKTARTLWNARLWSLGSLDTVLAATLWMTIPGSVARRGWSENPRVSMAGLLNLVDHDRLLSYRHENRRIADLLRLSDRVQRDACLPAWEVVAAIRDRGEAKLALDQIDRMLHQPDHGPARAHLYKFAHLIHERFGTRLRSEPGLRGDALERKAFDSVAELVARQMELPRKAPRAAILHDQVVWVTCPVRIDFAGGWSDTPPICTELGGTVVNAAVTLNGQYPVQVIAKLQDKPSITLTSLDLAERVEITATPAPAEYQNPREWAALPKAALILAGACPRNPRESLKKWLERMGGGLDITLFSALPKGSGLGTSSILGSAMLACLARVLGEAVSHEIIIARTSTLEQMMTTAGGWQDQIGGIEPGVKLIRTSPGLTQTPTLHRIAFDHVAGGSLHSRLLLYYTGYTRMARNILQKVVGRYLGYDREAIDIIRQLKVSAEQMERDLGAGDVDAFGRGIDRYWELKKRLDPGSTNPKIETLLKRLNRYLTGRLLTGAGGGGFLFMVARDAAAATRIRLHLERNPANPQARFFDFAIDQRGLSVTVL